MERIVTSIWRFVAGRDADKAREINVNRIAQGSSHDKALAAFKADQARIAAKRETPAFVTKRPNAR